MVVSALLYVEDRDALGQCGGCKYERGELRTIWEARFSKLAVVGDVKNEG